VTNSASDTISVINTETDEVVDTIEAGDTPTGVAIPNAARWGTCSGPCD
jgi:YVTN family beta-propeller protein